MSRPSLTTIFTPPSSCSSIITWNGNLFWQGGILQTNDPNCFPASFSEIFDGYYTPGICPQGWTSAGSLTGTGALVFNTAESNAMCCPSGYSMVAGEPVPGNNGDFCASHLTGTLTNVFSTTALLEGPIPETPSLTTLNADTLASPYAWQDVIQVRWQSTDTEILSLMATVSAAATMSSSPKSTPALASATSSAPSFQSSESGSAGSSSSLSTGASIGIGIGVAVAAMILIGFLILMVKRKWGKKREVAAAESTPEIWTSHKHAYVQDSSNRVGRHELVQPSAELPGREQRHELL